MQFDDLNIGDVVSVAWDNGTISSVTRGTFRGFMKYKTGPCAMRVDSKRTGEYCTMYIRTASILSVEVIGAARSSGGEQGGSQ